MVAGSDNGVTALLLEMQRLAERFGTLDQRETGHYQDLSEAMTGLGEAIDKLRGTGVTQGKAVVELGRKVTDLAGTVKQLLPPAPGPGYNPPPAARWWDESLPAQDRDKALTRIRRWVDRVYRTQAGHLAAGLGDCWDRHPLCVLALDWCSELWSVLYLQPARDQQLLSSQAEFTIRVLPALASQLDAETKDCHRHRSPAAADNGWGTR